ncbi:SUMF1/EgtB/PvdO family nonheme iron enzyme [Sulfidibacter corallicola]|uniref:SUMF1/EgtB/PvdO family nonheme iron enzyme n=1 Tax=Sulfidibacter corallicola TaxID=2818388 RepID=A0A8A4TTF2_SULCO|nr:SUMF1/EgtB/PvdO family nonheme iron enzyme [Sulfidibacter corallicola]QTD52800.1 SUMF1/EgtB/PvdO family nonheme iron enzyme [Sulfidibacter corallicola]
MTGYSLDDRRGKRAVGEDDFPLSIGGLDADMVVLESPGQPLAFLGLAEGRLFVQPGDGTHVLLNERQVAGSNWLRSGDLLGMDGVRVQVETDDDGICIRQLGTQEKAHLVLEPPNSPPPLDEAPPGAIPIQAVDFRPGALSESAPRRRGPDPRLAALLIFLTILGAVALFVFRAQPLSVQVNPVPDEMTLSGGLLRPKIGGRYLLWPGTYGVHARKEGYRPFETEFEVSATSPASMTFTLEKLPGYLNIAGPADAELFIDGESAGPLQTEPVELQAGTYQIEVRKDRYRPFSTSIEIEGLGRHQPLEAVLEPLFAEITFGTKPEGATVRVAGEETGPTPTAIELLEGTHAFEIVKRGYKPYRGQVTVVAQEPQLVSGIVLIPSDGNLLLETEPTRALVSLDGAYVGTTPLDLVLKPGREVRVEVIKNGYTPLKRSLRVSSGEAREERWSLKPVTAKLRLSVWPEDAEVTLNGKRIEPSTGVLDISTLPQEVSVSKSGYQSRTETFQPLPGLEHELKITLLTLQQAKKASIRQVYRTKAGNEMRLLKPTGTIEMGAPSREPGRRANEVQRRVRLQRPFYLGTTEISNEQFRRFAGSHDSGGVRGYDQNAPQQPVVKVTWQQAAAFCNWLSAQEKLPPFYVKQGETYVPAKPATTGYRLPTEAEWAWAARYAEPGAARKYPWGDRLPVGKKSGNYADISAANLLQGALTDYKDGYPVTAPVSSFSPNKLGIRNLGGNVAEWVNDFYDIGFGRQETPTDPLGPASGKFHVIRGSSWMHSTVTELRFSYRDYGDKARSDLGFRIARYLE